MIRNVIIFAAVLLTGCGSAINYQPDNSHDINWALVTTEHHIMSQHKYWRPTTIHITDRYIDLNYGSASVSYGYVDVFGLASSTSSSRSIDDRIYYEDNPKVQLMDWTRNFKQWYVVSIPNVKHIFYTRSLEDAEDLVDALNIIINTSQSELKNAILVLGGSSEETHDVDERSAAEQVRELKELYDEGLITAEEYNQSKKRVLEGIAHD